MLRKVFALFVGVTALALVLGTGVGAQEKKGGKKTLEGKLVCTKCELKETKKCGHALIVKEGDKEIKYYFDKDKGTKEKFHGAICQEPKDAKVTAKVVEKTEKGEKKLYLQDYEVEIKK